MPLSDTGTQDKEKGGGGEVFGGSKLQKGIEKLSMVLPLQLGGGGLQYSHLLAARTITR